MSQFIKMCFTRHIHGGRSLRAVWYDGMMGFTTAPRSNTTRPFSARCTPVTEPKKVNDLHWRLLSNHHLRILSILVFPDAPCMEYSHTFASFNYMANAGKYYIITLEHLGLILNLIRRWYLFAYRPIQKLHKLEVSMAQNHYRRHWEKPMFFFMENPIWQNGWDPGVPKTKI